MTVEPTGRDTIEARWRQLGWRRRSALVIRGDPPSGRREAMTALGYSRLILHRARLWALLGAVSAFVVVLALEMLIGGGVTTDSLVLGGAISVGVGLGLGVGSRLQARNLHRRAEAVLAESKAG